jgi:alkylation response protein AidB-like acyl-CoA dehydrogenase
MNDAVKTDRQKQIIAEARLFSETALRPHAGRFDREQHLPSEIIREMVKRRYTLAGLPESWGGLGLDPVHYGLFTEEIGKGCCSCRSLITVSCSLIGETLLKWGTSLQKSSWLAALAEGKIGAFALSEPLVGSDARGIQTVCERRGTHFAITGQKKWISFGEIADFFVTFAADRGQITAFIVERDRPGVAIAAQRGLMANRAAHLAQIDFRQVEVPEQNVIGRPGAGFAFIASTALDHGRYSIAWAGVAVAQAALDAMVAYARERKQFGAPIASFQLVQRMIANAATKTYAARTLCVAAGNRRAAQKIDATALTSMAKYFTSNVATEVASDALQVHGGNGCADSYPVERLFREARILEIIEGTSQIQEQVIAKFALKSYGRSAW